MRALLRRARGTSPAAGVDQPCEVTQIVLWNLSHFILPAARILVLSGKNGTDSKSQFEPPHSARMLRKS